MEIKAKQILSQTSFHLSSPCSSLPCPMCFLPPTSDEQLIKMQRSAIPNTTAKATNWSLNLWKEWAKNREALGHPHPDRLPHLIGVSSLNDSMCKFIIEVRRKNGNEYPANTLNEARQGILPQY